LRIILHKIGIPFERAILNYVGIRNAKGDFCASTDVDMLYGKDFIKTVVENLHENTFLESRTMYLKSGVTKLIYNWTLDPYNNLDSCRRCRIKKETTAGGFQCTSRENWLKIKGFDEAFVGWGSEDYDLLNRAIQAGLNIKWLGEDRSNIMLFHQHHDKSDIKKDLEYQEENKKILAKTMRGIKREINPNGWGGKND
jgi:GT2 family glycosyltransferase